MSPEATLQVRQSLRASRAPRFASVVLALIAVFVAAEAAARLGLWAVGRLPDPRAKADAYSGAAWPRAYFSSLRALELQWEPFVAWQHRAFAAEGITVDASSVRRTWQPPANGARSLRVLVFGGSTVFGIGARDEFTMPSELAKLGAASGVRVDVVNFGQTGYVTGQDAVHYWAEARAGERAQLVVFYGGASDAFAAWQSGEAGVPQNDANRAAEFNATQPANMSAAWRVLTAGSRRVLGGLAAPARAELDKAAHDALVAAVADRYVNDLRAACATAREFGASCLAVWQPMIIDKPALTNYESRQRDRYAGFWPFYVAVRDAVRARVTGPSSIAWLDASQTFSGASGPVFIDAFHTAERGYHAVAAAIAPAVTSRLPIAAKPQ